MPDFLDEQYASRLLKSMSDSRDDFCDVSFDVGGHMFPAHRVIIAASSCYFAAMLAGSFREKQLSTITLKGIPADAFSTLLDYVYTGSVTIEASTVMSVYETADILQYEAVKEKIKTFIKSDISHDTCFEYLLMARKHSLSDIEEDAKDFILRNFPLVIGSKVFTAISYELLLEFVSSEQLQCEERFVVDALSTWLGGHPFIDEGTRTRLVDTIRFGLLSDADFDLLLGSRTLLGENNVKRMENKLAQYQEDIYRQPFCCERFLLPREHFCLFAFGGRNREGAVVASMSIVPLKNGSPINRNCTLADPMPEAVTGAAALAMGNFIFVCGGVRAGGRVLSSSLLRYDVVQRMWLTLAPMGSARSQHAAVALDRALVALGGHGAEYAVELYNITENAWQPWGDLPVRSTSPSACVAGGAVYVTGLGEDIDSYSDAIYRLESAGGPWAVAGWTRDKCTNRGMCSQGNVIYIIGGDHGRPRTAIRSFGSFDIDSGQYTQIHLWSYYLADFTPLLFQNCIYIIGGSGCKGGQDFVQNVVLKFDIARKRWNEYYQYLPQEIRNCGTALVKTQGYK